MPHSSFHLIRRINTRRGGNETNKLENRPSPVLLAKLNLEIFCFFFSLSLPFSFGLFIDTRGCV